MKKHKNKIIAGIVIVIVLAFAFCYGGKTPAHRGGADEVKLTTTQKVEKKKTPSAKKKEKEATPAPSVTPKSTSEPLVTDSPSDTAEPAKAPVTNETANMENTVTKQKADEPSIVVQKPTKVDNTPMPTDENEALLAEAAAETPIPVSETTTEKYVFVTEGGGKKDKYQTDELPKDKPIPVEPQEIDVSDKEYTCTLSVRCDTILENIAWLDDAKTDIVPKDGVIFAEKTVTFYEGESVFNLLLREMKKNKIHMEFEDTPIYNSAYIEGIGNIYEFDCGELSGWMYKVNDWFPNYGCSRYQLKNGDKVEWVYTCNLGVDVGGSYVPRGN